MSSSAPAAEDITAMELWMLSCMMMVFAALCEYGVILFMTQRAMPYKRIQQQKEGKPCCAEHSKAIGTVSSNSNSGHSGLLNQRLSCVHPQECQKDCTTQQATDTAIEELDKLSMKLLKIDHGALIVFPIVFALFIIIYCVVFVQ